MGFFDDIAQQYGFGADASDQAAYEQGRLSDADIQARMEARSGSTSHRPHDSQTTDEAELAANAAADAGQAPAIAARGPGLLPPISGGGGSYGMFAGEGFGAAPAPFGEAYAPLARPSYLQGEYVPGQWGETFAAPAKPAGLQTPFALPTKPGVLETPYALPTQAELEASPGYTAGSDLMQRGMERSAAARGSVLSGGFVGRTLPRAMGEYAGSAYGNLVGQTLGARQQQVGEYTGDVNAALGARQQQFGEYSGDVSNAFSQYQQRYGQFADAQGLQLGARNTNEAAFQGDQATNLGGYNTRYGAYLDQAGMRRQAENDVWSRNRDLSDLSLRAAALARP